MEIVHQLLQGGSSYHEISITLASTNANHPSLAILFSTDSKYVKLAYLQILTPLQFTIP